MRPATPENISSPAAISGNATCTANAAAVAASALRTLCTPGTCQICTELPLWRADLDVRPVALWLPLRMNRNFFLQAEFDNRMIACPFAPQRGMRIIRVNHSRPLFREPGKNLALGARNSLHRTESGQVRAGRIVTMATSGCARRVR